MWAGFLSGHAGAAMSDRYREPRATSPERLALLSINSVTQDEYMVEVQATFLFDPHTPDWPGELSRAVTTLTNVISGASHRALKKRERKGAKQYEDLVVPGFENFVVPTSLQVKS